MTQETIVFPESFFACVRYYLFNIHFHLHLSLIAIWLYALC